MAKKLGVFLKMNTKKFVLEHIENITIPKELLALLRIIIEKAYDDGYKEGFSDGKYGP